LNFSARILIFLLSSSSSYFSLAISSSY
jgi:hypothetical protein